jgi:PAS domain S-box-containing protein
MFVQLLHSGDSEIFNASFEKALTGQSDPVEFRLLDREGKARYVRVSSHLLMKEDQMIGVAGIMSDITDRKKAELALHRRNRELRAITSCNEVLIRETDGQNLLDAVCRIICDEAGYRMAWVGFAENDDSKSVRPVAWAGFEEGFLSLANVTWADTERGRGPTGTAIRTGLTVCFQDFQIDPEIAPWRAEALHREYRSSIALPLKDEKGGVLGVLTIYSSEPNTFTSDEIRLLEELAGDLAFGITVVRARMERDQAEESLALTSFALNNVREAAFLIDEHARFHYVNEECCRVLGYSRQELLGMSVPDVDPDATTEGWEKHWPILEAKRSITFEGRHRTKDGRIIPVEISANFLEYGGDCYNLALARDITERKQAEEEQAILRQSLQQAQKMEAFGQLAGGIAHDFNNILAVVNGYSEILLHNTNLDAATRSGVQEILNAGSKGASLTRQLLAFSRKQVLQPKLVSLNNVLEDMHGMLRRLIGADIEMKLALDSTLAPVLADPSQMEQVILNLCINARDAMPDGGTISIHTSIVELGAQQVAQDFPTEAGTYICLCVSDTGTGMNPETLSHIFEPFFTTKGPDRGTGLGLATVYGIIKQSGGHVSVSSILGQGTTFCVYLHPAVKALKSHEPQSAPPLPARGTETILLVEDIGPLRTMTSKILRDCGYTVLEAENGEKALQLSQEKQDKISLLLTDIILPKMKGPALANSLKEQRPGLRVLFVSGYVDQAVLQNGMTESEAAFLQKPFTADELSKKIRELLDAA